MVGISLITDIAGISLKKSKLWIASFDYIKTNRAIQNELESKDWCKFLDKKKTKFFPLSEAQVTRLFQLLDKVI